jgi:hypothetical protein
MHLSGRDFECSANCDYANSYMVGERFILALPDGTEKVQAQAHVVPRDEVKAEKYFTNALIAALNIIALGEKDRLLGKGLSVEATRKQLAQARQRRK